VTFKTGLLLMGTLETMPMEILQELVALVGDVRAGPYMPSMNLVTRRYVLLCRQLRVLL
jgi:hypothetical protein